MKVILLCGGAGTRFNSLFPKPMNLVYGRPMIEYVVSTLSISHLTIFYNHDLDHYGFCPYLLNTFKEITFDFIPIHFQTRGAAETLYIGLNKWVKEHPSFLEESIFVLDNDNIYEGLTLSDLPSNNDKNFILCTNNKTQLSHYSFVTIEHDKIIDIQERNPISNDICMGGYGFRSVQLCLEACKKIVMENQTDEPYLSNVMKLLIDINEEVYAHYLSNIFSIGTPKDIKMHLAHFKPKKLRVVFDLDNTIVSYPHTYKDYSTVQPNSHIVHFIKYLKEKGHEVVVYTARKMVTHQNNVGKIIKDIGVETIQQLKRMGVDFDEIYFGKPYGDLYIDDKAFNTYDISMMDHMGFYDIDNTFLMNFDKTNQYNTILRINKHQIRKRGADLSGEIYYYQQIQKHPLMQPYFPKFYVCEDNHSILLEYIHGTSLSKLYYEGLFQPSLMTKLLNTLHTFHKLPLTIIESDILTRETIQGHYMNKFEERAAHSENYPFEDYQSIYHIIKSQLEDFLNKSYPIQPIIHGDFWFSNIMYYKNQFIFFDMRGKIGDHYTLQGHALYDYGKLYQSILGLDAIILYDSHIDPCIQQPLEEIFWTFILDNRILPESELYYLKRLTGYLIFNTFFAYDTAFEKSKKDKIWELVKLCIK